MENYAETLNNILTQINTSDAPFPEVARNPFCMYYDRCLDEAARLNLPELNCQSCEHQTERHWDRDQLMIESDACWNLLTAIFTGRGGLIATSSKRKRKRAAACAA